MAKQGEFVWHDLATSDMGAAVGFYGETIGWAAEPMPESEMTYHFFKAGETRVGGVMALSDDMKAAGAPPNWTPCIASEDLDALCREVKDLGGKVLNPPRPAPGGRFAVLQDPQGAVFESFQSNDNLESEQLDVVPPGHFCWYDLNTTDRAGAQSFYTTLFRWSESGVMEDSPAGKYSMFKTQSGDRSLGGMSNMAKHMGIPAHWLCYVTVEDLDASIARLKAQGGTLLNGPMAVPGGERIAHCMDPQGAAIALHAKK